MSGLSQEEKVAIKLSDLLSNLQLDVDLVGIYFAQMSHKAVLNRFEIMTESALQQSGEKVETMPLDERLIEISSVLSEFQDKYLDDSRFDDFFASQDIGFPLANAITYEWISDLSEDGQKWIYSTWKDFLEELGLEDKGWSSLIEIETILELSPQIFDL